MNRKEWNRIKAIKPLPGVWAHISKAFELSRLHGVMQYVPVFAETYNTGRNAAKRAARASGLRHIGKAPRGVRRGN